MGRFDIKMNSKNDHTYSAVYSSKQKSLQTFTKKNVFRYFVKQIFNSNNKQSIYVQTLM